MVQLWDDLFALCEAAGLRILLTPIDSFFTWNRWARIRGTRRTAALARAGASCSPTPARARR